VLCHHTSRLCINKLTACVTCLLWWAPQAPGLTFSIPREYASMPRLVGRAVVRLTIEKSDGALAFVNAKQGGLDKQGVVSPLGFWWALVTTCGLFISFGYGSFLHLLRSYHAAAP
jgi:hypothetical protein